MLKELSLCHAGWRNDNYADNNGNNNSNGNENGYDKGTGHKECRDIVKTVFKLHRIHLYYSCQAMITKNLSAADYRREA